MRPDLNLVQPERPGPVIAILTGPLPVSTAKANPPPGRTTGERCQTSPREVSGTVKTVAFPPPAGNNRNPPLTPPTRSVSGPSQRRSWIQLREVPMVTAGPASASLRYLKQRFPACDAYQVHLHGHAESVTTDRIHLWTAARFLVTLV